MWTERESVDLDFHHPHKSNISSDRVGSHSSSCCKLLIAATALGEDQIFEAETPLLILCAQLDEELRLVTFGVNIFRQFARASFPSFNRMPISAICRKRFRS